MPEFFNADDIEMITKDVLGTGISEFICTHEIAREIWERMSAQFNKTLDANDPIYVQLKAEQDIILAKLTYETMVVMRDFLTQSINEYNHMKVQS